MSSTLGECVCGVLPPWLWIVPLSLTHTHPRSGKFMGDEYATAMAAGAFGHKPACIDLRDNHLTGTGVKALDRMDLSRLKLLHLGDNHLGVRGCHVLTHALVTVPTALHAPRRLHGNAHYSPTCCLLSLHP